MAIKIVMPRLGWTMEEGVLIGWLKQHGDPVRSGDALLTVEGDKATSDVEALDDGILYILPDSPPPGTTVLVGRLLAYLLEPGESAPFEQLADPVVQNDPQPEVAQSATRTIRRTTPPISPRARRTAERLGVDWANLNGSGRTGRIVERDILAANAVQPPIRATPVARRMAAELGVDLADLASTQAGRRVERADVVAATPIQSGSTTPLSMVRRVIAERMLASAHTTAPVTLTTEADATELVRLRTQLKQNQSAPVPGYTDLLVKIAAHTLSEHPALNVRLEGDMLISQPEAHIGIAIDTERGLLVPVLREAGRMGLRTIARATRALAERARTGQLSADEMRGGTFTITNLGMYGIDAFTPIINLPECAILGVGRIVPKPVVVDVAAERITIRHMVVLSLTFDHRLIDGAPAARFLQRIVQLVEQPYVWLVTES